MSSLLPPAPSAQRSPGGDVIRIDPATLAVAGALAAGEVPGSDDLGKVRVLVHAGLAHQPSDVRLPPVLDADFVPLVRVLTAARLAAHVQRFVGCRTHTATVLVAAAAGVVVEHDRSGLCLLTLIDAASAPSAAARLVGFDPLDPTDTAVVAPPAPRVLDEFHAHLVAGDQRRAADLLHHRSRLEGWHLELLLGLVTGACHSWRVVTRNAALSVVDDGPRGLWSTGGIEAPEPDSRFAPTSPAAVRDDLAALFADRVRADEAA